MRIVFDARWIFNQLSGIGLYTQELLRAFARQGGGHEFLALYNDEAVWERTRAAAGLDAAPHIRDQCVPFGVFHPRGQIELPLLLRRLDADVYHSPNYYIPLAPAPGHWPRTVVTLHDLIPLLFPHCTPRALKTRFFPVYRWLMRRIAARADMILTDSEHSRADIIRCLGIPARRENRVRAILLAADRRFAPDPAEKAHAGEILYVGRLDPYKNVVALVEALAGVAKSIPSAHLRIIGPPDPRYPEAPARAHALGIADRVAFSGYVSDADLIAAYRRAAVLCLPSQYEGFGLPVLEAMACGTPVVCSAASSLPEIAGAAALLVPPGDVPALTAALTRVLSDSAVAADLARKGLAQAARFTWERTAQETLRAYEAAVVE